VSAPEPPASADGVPAEQDEVSMFHGFADGWMGESFGFGQVAAIRGVRFSARGLDMLM
jgi:hypothetical protein